MISDPNNPFHIVDPKEPEMIFGLWREREPVVNAVFAADGDIAEIAFELIHCVNLPGNEAPTSCRYRYHNHDGEELAVSILAFNHVLASAAWHFEQAFLPVLEDTLFQLSMADPVAEENMPNAIWSFCFRRGWQFIAQPFQHDCPKIMPLFRDTMSGHEKIAAVAHLEERWKARKAFGLHQDRRRWVINMAAHEARATELINYNSEQVTRRRNLEGGIRKLIASGALDASKVAELEALLAANGPI